MSMQPSGGTAQTEHGAAGTAQTDRGADARARADARAGAHSDRGAGSADAASESAAAASLPDSAIEWFEAVVAYLRGIAALAAAETRDAAIGAVTMLALAIVAAVLLIVGWVFIAAVVAYALVQVGVPWALSGLLVAALHGVAAYVLFRIIVKLSRSLTWPVLRRTLLGEVRE